MEYYQTEVLVPIEKEWNSAQEIVKSGDKLLMIASKKMMLPDAEVELERLKKAYKNLDFKIMPFSE